MGLALATTVTVAACSGQAAGSPATSNTTPASVGTAEGCPTVQSAVEAVTDGLTGAGVNRACIDAAALAALSRSAVPSGHVSSLQLRTVGESVVTYRLEVAVSSGAQTRTTSWKLAPDNGEHDGAWVASEWAK